MNNTILSICIPTYNRAACLKDCLGSIVVQFENQEVCQQVEVVISDNASTDKTQEVVEEFQSRFNNIKYFKNSENLGFDRNILNVIGKSTGEYCLTIGDDDGFLQNSLLTIIQKIKFFKSPYFILNCWGYDKELQFPVVSHPNLTNDKDLVFHSLSEYMVSRRKYIDLIGNFGGMSTQLFLRSAWVNYDGKDKFIGTQCIHMFVLLTIFKNSPFIILADPLIKTRSSNVRWATFPGLETAKNRVKKTTESVLWVKNQYNLPMSDFKIKLYFLSREYWSGLKNIIKDLLYKIGLGKILYVYRKLR